MICMFQQYQVDYEDMQVFMCKCPLVLTGWRMLVQLILGTVVYSVHKKYGNIFFCLTEFFPVNIFE